MSATTDEATRAEPIDAASVETVEADALRETPIASLKRRQLDAIAAHLAQFLTEDFGALGHSPSSGVIDSLAALVSEHWLNSGERPYLVARTRINGMPRTYALHSDGVDLFRVVEDERKAVYVERRLIGPLLGMDYEERTSEAGIDIYVGDHRVGDEPLRITLKAPAKAEHQIALIRTLRKWARTETPEHRVGAKRL